MQIEHIFKSLTVENSSPLPWNVCEKKIGSEEKNLPLEDKEEGEPCYGNLLFLNWKRGTQNSYC